MNECIAIIDLETIVLDFLNMNPFIASLIDRVGTYFTENEQIHSVLFWFSGLVIESTEK